MFGAKSYAPRKVQYSLLSDCFWLPGCSVPKRGAEVDHVIQTNQCVSKTRPAGEGTPRRVSGHPVTRCVLRKLAGPDCRVTPFPPSRTRRADLTWCRKQVQSLRDSSRPPSPTFQTSSSLCAAPQFKCQAFAHVRLPTASKRGLPFISTRATRLSGQPPSRASLASPRSPFSAT